MLDHYGNQPQDSLPANAYQVLCGVHTKPCDKNTLHVPLPFPDIRHSTLAAHPDKYAF
jgi:hypothetical protein